MSAKVYVNREGVPPLAAGEWAWVVNQAGEEPFLLAFGCPCGGCTEGSLAHNGFIAITGSRQVNQHVWKWDGNLDEPTLTPSIQRLGACKWHGYLRAGKFEEGE